MDEDKLILVTGANGFIGSHVLQRLSASPGLKARGMVRPTSSLWRLENFEPELIRASLPGNLPPLDGVHTVIHTAGLSSDWGSREEFTRANREGTACLLEAAIKAGVKRFIHFSSVVVYGFTGGREQTEDAPLQPFPHPYCLSKAEAEKEVLARRERIETVIIRPANVYGPGDLTTTFPLLQALEKGLPFFPAGGRSLTSPCYVGNLVEATIATLNSEGAPGETFNVTDGRDMPWRDFLSLAASALDARSPRFPLPARPLYLAAGVLEALYKAIKSSKPPLITPYRIAQVTHDYGFSIDRARRILGYQPAFSPEEGLRKSVRWYRKMKQQPPEGG